MAKASPVPPIHTVLPPANLPRCNGVCTLSIHPSLHFGSQHHRHRRTVSAQAVAPSFSPPINVDYLDREFGGHGANFRGLGDGCVVKMVLDSGSTASLMLPSGLITSYKPQMWHGTTVEVLQTSVSEGEDGEHVIQGGVSLGFKGTSEAEHAWSPSTWALRDVRGSPESSVQVNNIYSLNGSTSTTGKQQQQNLRRDSFWGVANMVGQLVLDQIQVELVSADTDGGAEMKYLVTLQEDLLASELTVTNLRSSSLCLVGSVVSHLKVSTPDATYAVGLQGSDYHSQPPMSSGFSIIPPGFSMKKPSTSSRGQPWGQKAIQGLLSGWGRKAEGDVEAQGPGEGADESEGEEDDNYHQLTEKMSRIYTSAPREFTIIDRGRRNSVVVERRGFDEFYVFSPGSGHEWYGKYAYVCTGPSAILAPIVLGPGGVWRGGQYLHNPNM